MTIIDAALSRSRTTFLIFFLFLIAGVYSYVNIPKESDPDINIPIIYVSMHLEGISPSDAERILIKPMEQELNTIEGIKEMRATGYLGGANVILEFDAGFDADLALTDVREAVDKAKSELPEEADEPVVEEVNFSLFPILVVTLSGDLPERTLLKIIRRLQDRIESIESVLEASIAGDREEQVEILIDPTLIESYGLRGDELISFFNQSNKLVAAGNIDTGTGRFAIKLPGLFESVQDIMNMPVKVSGDSTILLGDIASIRKTYKDPEGYAWMQGEKALALEIVKRSGENVIETIEAVKAVVAEEQKFWPATVQLTYSQDRSIQIKRMLSDLQNNIISAVLLVMILTVAILGVRAGLLVGVSIPGSFLTGLLILYVMGLTVNVVVLFALILAVGMLVDGAIVVTEYADREMLEGNTPKEAYAIASKRMAWPIIASTATTLAAFLPLLFWPDIVGEFMFFLPLTLIATLMASLLMALIFVPTMGAYIGRRPPNKVLVKTEDLSLKDILSLKGGSGTYARLLNQALKFPVWILSFAFILLIAVQILYVKQGKGIEFFPDIEPEVISVLVHARGNLSIEEQDSLVRDVSSKLFNISGIKSIYARSGKSPTAGNDLSEDVIGQIQLELEEWNERPKASKIKKLIKEETQSIGGIIVEIREQQEGPRSGKALQIELRSQIPELLEQATKTVLRAIDQVGGFVDIEDNRPVSGLEWQLNVDRSQAAKFGLDTTSIGNIIRIITNGLKVGEYRPDDSDDEVDIVVRHSKDFRTIDQLDNVRIETASGSVPVVNFVQRVAQPKVGEIHRVDQQRSVKIQADLPSGVNVNDKLEELKAVLETEKIHPEIRVEFKGDDENQKESQAFLTKAFVVALFLMLIILVTQFNSFYSALLILSAVIMSTVGVLVGLLITDQAFGVVMTGVGIIALAGIVVNNNIVLIDTFDYLKNKKNIEPRQAILLTGLQRLRPVLLTTITTILGLLPMVLQINVDFITREVTSGAPSTQWWVSLATAVVFGLMFSTVLTLFVTPSALMIRIRFLNWREKHKIRKK